MSKYDEQGLTLLEVLISLSIISFVIFSVKIVGTSSRDKVDGLLDVIEQSVRYAQHEAILRNTVMRVRFILDSNPQEYLVEAGPNGNFVLPLFEEFSDPGQTTLALQERRDKILKGLNSKFSKLSEFEKSNGVFDEMVKIIGIGSSLISNKMVQDGDFSFYIYPEGEKDAGIIILATTNEIVSLTIAPFMDEFERTYHTIEAKEESAIIEEQESVAKEMYESWVHGRG